MFAGHAACNGVDWGLHCAPGRLTCTTFPLQTTVLGYPTPPGTYVLEHHEVPFNTLDTIPILCCFAAFIAFHPGWYLEPAAGGANGGDVDKCVALPQQQQPKAGGSGGKRCAVWADASGGGV